MKQKLVLLLSLLLVTVCFGQERHSKVTLKNGVAVTGTIKEFNPTTHILLSVAGFDTRIEMSEIVSIEESPISSSDNSGLGDSKKEKIVPMFLDENFPESYLIEVGPFKLEMVLMQGAQFRMGYEGRGSLRMRSEPIHDVILHSFYVNKEPISKELVKYLNSKSKKEFNIVKNTPFSALSWYEAHKVAVSLAKATQLPIDLISEAQWEYMIVSKNSQNLPMLPNETNFCRDYLADYEDSDEPIIDPVRENPDSRSFSRVVRSIDGESSDIYTRYDDRLANGNKAVIRISFPASVLQ